MYVFSMLIRIKSRAIETDGNRVFEIFAQKFHSFFEGVAIVFVAERGTVPSEIF